MYVYLITNTLNDKKYVGQTKRNLKERWYEHLKKSNNIKINKLSLKNDIILLGKEYFKLEILKECSSLIELNYYEKFFIQKYNTIQEGYNLNSGGTNHELSEDYKKYISENSTCSKEVFVFDSEGNFLKSFYSVNQACRELNVNSKNAFRILAGKRKTTKGYFFSYEKKYLAKKDNRKKVYKYDLEGNFLKEYISIVECANDNNTSSTCIKKVIKKQLKQLKGYLYSFIEINKDDFNQIKK